MSDISRRSFIRGTAILAAGVAAAADPAIALARMSGMTGGGMTGGGMGGGGMGGGTSVIDPPVGGPFLNPPVLPDLSADPAVVEVALDARLAPASINGTTAQLMTYNGISPGGTIRVRNDQLLRVRFSNSLPANGATNMLGHKIYETNLHTHGLHVTPGDNANGTHGDNMMVMVEPGESATYEYDLSRQRAGSMNFYHPHIHGCVADQMWGGLAGSLIVEDPTPALAAYPERIMVLKDIDVANGAPAPHSSMMDYMHGKEGSTVMVNGAVNPRLEIAPGSIQRWRIVNASTARFYRLSLASHSLYLVGTDGGWLDKPYAMSEVLLSPGERIDVLVKATQSSGSFKLLSLPYSRNGMMSSPQITLLTLAYKGAKTNQALPSAVDPTARRVSMNTSSLKRVRMELSMGQGRGYINGISFQSHDNAFMTHSELGTWEVWEVVNNSGMDHPFHHHTNSAQVLSITGGDSCYARMCTMLPAWKDVTIVPKMGKIELLVPVMDYGGMAMLHCHIIEHEDIGMMGIWHIMDGMGGM